MYQKKRTKKLPLGPIFHFFPKNRQKCGYSIKNTSLFKVQCSVKFTEVVVGVKHEQRT